MSDDFRIYKLMELAEVLHMSRTGASDRLSDIDYVLCRAELMDRLNKWSYPSTEYDNAIKDVCVMALREGR